MLRREPAWHRTRTQQQAMPASARTLQREASMRHATSQQREELLLAKAASGRTVGAYGAEGALFAEIWR